MIPSIHRIIPYHRIEVHAAFFFDGVAADPSAEFGAVVAVVVVDETGFVVMILAAEAERVDFGQFAGRGEEPTERVVDVFRGFRSRRVDQRHHVLVAIRDIVVGLAVIRHRKRRVKPGRFRVPRESHGHRIAVQRVQHLNQLVTVVDEFLVFRQHVRGVDLLLEAAPHVVVAEFKPRIAVLRRNQAVFTVPTVAPAHDPGQHIAVHIVGRIPCVHRPNRTHIGVLVQYIARQIVIGIPGSAGFRPVADIIITESAIVEARRDLFLFSRTAAFHRRYLTFSVIPELPVTAVFRFHTDALVLLVQRVAGRKLTVQLDLRQTVLRVVFERPSGRGPRRREAGKLIQAGAVGIRQRISAITESRNTALRIVSAAFRHQYTIIQIQLTQRPPPKRIVTVTVPQIYYTRNRLIYKLRLCIVGQISRTRRIRYRHRTIQIIVSHRNRRRFVRITHPDRTARSIVSIGRNHAARPGTGQQLAVRIIAVGRTGSVRIRLRNVEAAIIVGPTARAAQRASVRVIGEFRLNAGFPRIPYYVF